MSDFPTPLLEIAPGPTALSFASLMAILAPINWWRLNEPSGANFADSGSGGFTANIDINATFQHVTYAQPGALPGDPDTSLGLGVGGVGGVRAQGVSGTPSVPRQSIAFWFRTDQPTVAQPLVCLSDTNFVARLWLDSSSRLNLDGYPAAGGTKTTLTSTGKITDTGWHLIVLENTFGAPAQHFRVYVDGALFIIDTGAVIVWPSQPTYNIWLGYDNRALNPTSTPAANTIGTLIGQIDEAARFDYFLNTSQMAQLVAAAGAPTTTSWIDISDKFIGGSTGPLGRQQELDRIEPSSGRLGLDNTDRTFDPTNTTSSLYGQLSPAEMRLSWVLDGVPHVVLRGFPESYQQVWELPSEARVEVTLTDGGEQLALADVSAFTWAAELSGARINHALDAALWPADRRRIDPGVVTIAAAAFTSAQGALGHMQDVAEAELGYFFISADGYATFHDQDHRSSAGTTAIATFSDRDDGNPPYEDLSIIDLDRSQIINDVTITTADAGVSRVTDPDSIRDHRSRALSRSSLAANAADGLVVATLIVAAKKDPIQRIEQMILAPAVLDPAGIESDVVWWWALNLGIGDLVTILKTPGGIDPATIQDCYVESVALAFPGGVDWLTTLQLSPASAARTFIARTTPVTGDVVLIQRPYFPVGVMSAI